MKLKTLWIAAVVLAVIITAGVTVSAADYGMMSKEELKNDMENGEVIILDVRSGNDWSSSEFKIKGAHRADPKQFKSWVSNYPKDKKIILYCA